MKKIISPSNLGRFYFYEEIETIEIWYTDIRIQPMKVNYAQLIGTIKGNDAHYLLGLLQDLKRIAWWFRFLIYYSFS
jgi:hypothetical protein